jgi:hypothetical protein
VKLNRYVTLFLYKGEHFMTVDGSGAELTTEDIVLRIELAAAKVGELLALNPHKSVDEGSTNWAKLTPEVREAIAIVTGKTNPDDLDARAREAGDLALVVGMIIESLTVDPTEGIEDFLKKIDEQPQAS